MANANVLALEEGPPSSGPYNIGAETSVNRLYELLNEISGKDLPPRHGPARPGEQLRSAIDPTKAARILGWRPEAKLTTGFESALRSFGAIS